MDDLRLFAPELAVVVGALIAFAGSVLEATPRRVWLLNVFMASVAVAASVWAIESQGYPFARGIYRVDALSQLLKFGVAVSLLATLALSGDASSYRLRARADVGIFLFLGAAGLMLLASATELLTLYVSLELAAYSLYILAALHRNQRAGSEAAVKFILFGAASSAVTLFGISLVFGMTRNSELAAVAARIMQGPPPLLVVGLVLMLVGFLFKLAVWPFHAWAPDTYQAAPHPAVVFIGTASKVVAAGVLVRVSFAFASKEMSTVLAVVGVASMTFGNLAALAQKDIKRLLAYSTVAQAGYMLIGLVALGKLGAAATLYYALTYVPMMVLALAVVCALGRDGRNPTLQSLSGLYQRSPLLAFSLLVAMFGLAGIPPTPGFVGKWFLFSAALEANQFWLVIVAAINATVSLYYYLQIVRYAFVSGPGQREAVRATTAQGLTIAVSAAVLIFAGSWPGPIWDMCLDAAKVVGLR